MLKKNNVQKVSSTNADTYTGHAAAVTTATAATTATTTAATAIATTATTARLCVRLSL